MHRMQALLVAALLYAALPGGLAVSRYPKVQQPSYAAGSVAGLLWQGTPSALSPTNFTVMFPGGVTPAQSGRIEVHLPGFGGTYNSFGAIASPTALAGNFLPIQNGIRPYSVDNSQEAVIEHCIAAAEWDPKRELLRIKVYTGTNDNRCTRANFDGVTIDEGYLRQLYQRHGLPSGKGPLPPRGGIDAMWFRKAWMRTYDNAACTGASYHIASETCDYTHSSFAEYPFNIDMARNMMFETTNDWVPTQHVGAVGVAAKPAFTWLAAAGDTSEKEASNCITVTLMSSVALTTTSATDSRTDITISGLTGSDTPDTDTHPIFAGGECAWTPGTIDVHDNTNSLRQAQSSATALELLVSPLSSSKAWQGKFNKEAGTLIVRIGTGFSIEAGEVVTFSFQLTNGKTAQASRELSASVKDGYYCKSNLCGTSDDVAVTIAPTKFNSMSEILEIKEPTFEIASLYQSTTKPNNLATITVSLKPNTALQGVDSKITLTGLCGGKVTTDAIDVFDMFGSKLHEVSSPSTKNIAAQADWDSSKQQLKLSMGSIGMTAGTLYVFTVKWTLLEEANAACPVTVAASGTASFSAAPMSGTVGAVDAPAFVTAKIGQTSTRPNALNFICVTLKTNKNFNSQSAGKQEQSKFTLTGLTGSQHEDELGVQLYECPSNTVGSGSNEFSLPTKDGWAMPLPTRALSTLTATSAPFLPDTGNRQAGRFDFTAATGAAVFVMDTNGFTANQEYVFAIMVTNSKTASPCKTVTLTASGDITQTVEMSTSAYVRALIDGETDGDVCPLKVYDPGFLTKIVSSDTKLAEATATITVTLRSNVDLASTTTGFKSMITISGLTGSKTDDTTTLSNILKSGTGNVVTSFSPNFDDVQWTQNTGTLILGLKSGACLHPGGSSAKSNLQTCLKAGVEYVFELKLVNGKTSQSAPAVSIEASYDEPGTKTAKQVVSGPLEAGCTADQPLKIVPKDQILCSYKIGQIVTTPGASNPICVTLKTNKDLSPSQSGPVAFTISGLTGFSTDSDVYPDAVTSVLVRDASSGETVASKGTDRLGRSLSKLNDMFCKDSVTSTTTTGCKSGDANQMKFSETKGEIEFFLSGSKTMSKGDSYAFCFHLVNPKTPAACKTDISIKAQDSDMLKSAAVSFPMKVASGDACVGFVLERMFTTANIRTSSNVTSMDAGLFLELTSNYEIKSGKVITISGLRGYATTPGDVTIFVTKNGRKDRTTFCKTTSGNTACEASFSDQGELKLTVKQGEKVEAKNSFRKSGSTALTNVHTGLTSTPELDDIYEIYFTLKNPEKAQSAAKITVTSEDFKAEGVVDSGLAKSRRSQPATSSRRAGGDLVFSFTPKTGMSGGESIILELPLYSIDVEGPVFGITSSNDAFTTYADRNSWEVGGNSVSKARALFTNGYQASGTKSGERSQSTSGLDGFFMLATGDSDGIGANKLNWFTESTLWEGTLQVESTAGSQYTAHVNGHYGIKTTTAWQGSPMATNPNNLIATDDLVGMRLTCSTTQVPTHSGPKIFGTDSQYVTESAYILENAAGGAKIIVESGFSSSIFTLSSTNLDPVSPLANAVLNAQCRIEYKPSVGKYTGMTVMFDNGKEFVMKQGAGALYQVTDGSGSPPSAHDLEGRAYTIYSQLEITAALGETVEAGETVTISIPKSAGISAPADLTAPVVDRVADGNKCEHYFVPNVDSNLASPDLGTAKMMTAQRKCNYDGSIPKGDVSIAAKSTIRRVFASALGRSSSTMAASTARLSKVAPYGYSGAESGPTLLGKPMDVYGAISLQASVTAAASETAFGAVALSSSL